MIIRHKLGKDNGRADTLSKRPDYVSEISNLNQSPLQVDTEGDLRPTEGIRIALISIIENTKEFEDFKNKYGNEPKLYIWVSDEKSYLD